MNDQEKAKPQVSAVAKREEEVLKMWNEKKIFKKTLEKESPKGNFVFYDGPPFATGLPHFGHMLPTTMKDAIPRYKTMRGFHVERKWGWDCHGLPIENLIEKELGLATKKDIENYGVGKFNAAAAASVLRYAHDWKEIIPRLGRWVDMDDDYRTMDWTYTESVWWSFKTLFDKGLVYKGFKSMHICPRCETTLSNFEVNQGYKDITDISVYVKFELADEPGTFLLAWTTTPWTLPGNVALAVRSDIPYVRAKKDGAVLIIAKSLVEKVLKEGYEIEGELAGSELAGRSYKPLFDYYAKDSKLKNRENGWKVYAADFVTTEDGTGIVHIAPAFGSDDYALLGRENLPFVQHVTMSGVFRPEVADFAGQPVKPKDDHQKADIEVIKHLAGKGTLFAKEKVVHSYPHCWRCDTPLLNYATSSWFIKVSDLKQRLVDENSRVNWVPGEIGEKRFAKGLESAPDWAISRSRYWGAPLPVWECKKCEKTEVVGSVAELANKEPRRNTFFIMRHGQADTNKRGVVCSDDSIIAAHLTDEGRGQAKEAAEGLKAKQIHAMYASPMIRTRETAEIVAEAIGFPKEKIVFDERIREAGMGVYNGKPLHEYHGYFSSTSDRFESAPEGGETYTDVKRRMGEFLEEVNARHEGETVLIVSHETPLWLLTAAAEGLTRAQTLSVHGDGLFIDTGTARELRYVPLPRNADYELDLHRPHIDSVAFTCACGGEMRRIPEVFDTWYDSGSMPYAQNHYPFEHKDEFEKGGGPLYPADFIAEGLDQTRGWFYTLMVLNASLFGVSPYKNVVVNGLILAEDGRKMSKKLKNYPDLLETVGKYGADSLRYFLISSPAVRAEEVLFSEKGVDEVMKKIVQRLGNVVSFYEMYSDGAEAADPYESGSILDRWILARLDETSKHVTDSLERYELDRASRPIADFVDDLSTWYIRRSRDRFKGDDASDRANALSTTRSVLLGLSKLMAPFMPFTAEDVYMRARGEKESVHLESWPEAREFDDGLIADMAETRKIVSLALEARAKANIKVRQPLSLLRVKKMAVLKGNERELCLLIMDEVNVKLVSNALEDDAFEGDIHLDTVITPELKEEGSVREFIRSVQDMRKQAGLDPNDKVRLRVSAEGAAADLLRRNGESVSRAVGAAQIAFEAGLETPPIDIDGAEVRAAIDKI